MNDKAPHPILRKIYDFEAGSINSPLAFALDLDEPNQALIDLFRPYAEADARIALQQILARRDQMAQLPAAQRSDIVDAFENILAANGEVTTLEVKNLLRTNGFWATQDVVSAAINDYFRSGEHENAFDTSLDFRVDSFYRVYFAKPIDLDDEDEDDDLSGVAAPVPTTVAVKVPVVGDWNCNSLVSIKPTARYHGVTRNQARYLYSQDQGVPYTEVSAKKA